MCSNHVRLMPRKKGFPSLPPPKEGLLFVISSWGHVSELD
jgi:hypothetical protein